MEVKLISVIPEAEKIMGFCARVSNPSNQDNPNYSKLLKYCADHAHWSVFEMADMTVEIETSRAIAQQILRHRSFTFQEFSQRYAKAELGFERYPARRQDIKNRQNSIDDMNQVDKRWFEEAQKDVEFLAEELYKEALTRNIAKEQARFLLPLSTKTRLYMKGSVRSWIHYINLRADKATQLEHQQIALAIKEIFKQQFPTTAEALGWTNV